MTFALHQKRFEWCCLEWRRGALDRRPAGHELARGGLGHQAGREVHCVTHHGVHPAPRSADFSGEHMTGVDPHAHRQPDIGVEQGTTGGEHPTLTILDCVGGARRQDDLHSA